LILPQKKTATTNWLGRLDDALRPTSDSEATSLSLVVESRRWENLFEFILPYFSCQSFCPNGTKVFQSCLTYDDVRRDQLSLNGHSDERGERKRSEKTRGIFVEEERQPAQESAQSTVVAPSSGPQGLLQPLVLRRPPFPVTTARNTIFWKQSTMAPTSTGTFQPLRHRSGTLRERLHAYTKRTLGAGGSYNDAVRGEHGAVVDW
jgi:hypothetical protein